MASQYDGDDDGNLIEDDKIDEFYDRFNNEVDESLAEEEEGIVKSSSSFVFGKTSSLRYYPLINRAENIFRYNQQKPLINQQKHQPKYRSLGSSSVSEVGGDGSTGGILRNQLRSIPLKSNKFSNSLYKKPTGIDSGRSFEYILPRKRFRKLEATTNDNNNQHFKTDTSISGFKNHTSTNYDYQQIKEESKIDPNHTQNKRLFETRNHQENKNQLHSHQTRSIIEGGLQQQKTATGGAEEAIGSSRSGVSIEKVEISWIEPNLPLTPILVLSIFGIVICAIFILFWLKNFILNFYKNRTKDHRINEGVNKSCQIYRKEGQNFIKENFKVMDDDPKTYKNNDNHQLDDKNFEKYKYSDSDDDYDYDRKVIDNNIIDELHSNFDSLTIEQTPKNDVLLVDKKSSPIVLDQIGENDSHRHFIFTTTPATLTSSSVQQTIDLNSSIFGNCNNRLTGIVPVAAVPIPVPVPLPIPIPVPIPVLHQQQIYKSDKSYHNQGQQSNEQHTLKKSGSSRPLLIKSSSTTSSVSLTTAQTTPQINRSRRFSLCERRSHSPQTTSLSGQQHQQQQHPKSQSISRLSRRDYYDYDFYQNNQLSDSNPSNSTIIQKSFDNTNKNGTDDKENEIPAGGGEIYSPKMKLTEQILVQQNSPRSFNESPSSGTSSSTVMRFTFSPKQILANSENGSSSSSNNNNNNNINNINNSASPPVQQSSSGGLCQPSPLLNSAVYKHGNYFKFPEVDCLTPDKIGTTPVQVQVQVQHQGPTGLRKFNQNSLESHPSSDESGPSGPASSSCSSSPPPKMKPSPVNLTTPPVNLTTPPINQSTRRARLKSISLDSDGARLVEDNLGIPVEEIIERANQSPIIDDDCFVFEDTISNQGKGECSEIRSHQTGKLMDQKMIEPQDVDTVDGRDEKRFIGKNKNHLTITIGPDLSEGSPNSESGDNFSGDSVKFTHHQQTPKTPTLTQTKQKAISLDSSDTNIIYCLPSSVNIGSNTQKNRADSESAKTSLLQISSISVPTTPKRQQLLLSSSSVGGMGKKLQSTKSSKNRLLSTTSKIGLSKSSTSTPSTSFDHDVAPQKPQGFITKLRSFNENTLDDGFYDDANFYLEPENDIMVVDKRPINSHNREFSSDLEDDSHVQGQHFSGSNSSLLGANLQNQKCTTSLSLSNNNLKTLPEVMTISDFSTDTQELHNPDDDKKLIIKSIPSPGICNNSGQGGIIGIVQKTPRNSILQRRGSNHSLTLNLNGSLGNLTKSLSVSNYSLGSTNLQTSQCNLSGSSHNLTHHQQQQQQISGSGIVTPAQIGVPQGSIGGPTAVCGLGGSKKNLLQRRGSNTSLTLNIKGSSCVNLNRFNSHSSLNIASMQHQNHPHQMQQQQQQHVQSHQLGTLGGGGGGCTKKGLLERRNSNASLTLNIQNRALSISNCNLRGSACSLSSVNTNAMDYDGTLIAEHHNEEEPQQQYDLHYPNSAKHRKFLSSENLNSITQCSKLNQTHVRNSTKTCFGSVSDLKPHQMVQQKVTPQNMQKLVKEIGSQQTIVDQKHLINTFGESNLCSCTGVRNITTKPLSPQSTSEDFKMYLANIQLLQNASNVLDDEHLRKLSYIFEKSYNMTTMTQSDKNDTKLEIRATSITATSAIDDPCINDDIIDITINFEAPNDDEQKLLLRNLHQEFWDLPTNYQEKPLVFGSQAKNRYKTILPNEHSRVILDSEPGFVQEPYINANYIKGPDYTQNSYIATQGPMSNTIYEYWLMIYQNVSKFSSIRSSINKINRTILEEHFGNHGHVQQLDINVSNNFENIQNNIGIILKPKTPTTTETISISNAFAPGFSNSNYKSKECNSGKFNQKIVMLTNFVENNRQKCSIYFPIDAGKIILITNTNDKIDSGDLIQFYENYFNKTETDDNTEIDGDSIKFRDIIIDDVDIRQLVPKSNYFIIRNCGIVKKNGFSIRKLQCIYCPLIDNENHQYREFFCNHYWFPDWPDHRSPNDIDVLLDMSLHLLDGSGDDKFNNFKIDYEMAPPPDNVDNQPLPIIHCSAGIGRTGCLAAILNGLRQMRASLIQLAEGGSSKKNNINVDVLGIVCNLRLQRGGMVQNSEQYELIHRALCLYLKRLDFEKNEISVDEISDEIATNKKITSE